MNPEAPPMEDLQDECMVFMHDRLKAGYDALDMAAVFMVQALTLYRTVLSPEEYDMIVDHVSERRDQILTYRNMMKAH